MLDTDVVVACAAAETFRVSPETKEPTSFVTTREVVRFDKTTAVAPDVTPVMVSPVEMAPVRVILMVA